LVRTPTERTSVDRSTRAHALEAARITGEVATPRENNLSHIHRFLAQERQFDFGVELTRDWDYDAVFALMVDRAGLRPDPEFVEGVDTISTEACIEALGKLAEAVGRVSPVAVWILFAAGHPAGLLPVHMAIAAAARSAGAVIDTCDHVIAVPEVGGDVRQIHDVWTWHLHGGS